MRTTVHLAEAVKAKAAREHRNFTHSWRRVCAPCSRPASTTRGSTPIPKAGERGGSFLIDLEDRDVLWAVLDADDVGNTGTQRGPGALDG